MRHFINIIESAYDLNFIQYESETPEEIANALKEMNARKVEIPNHTTIYIVDDKIVEWSGNDVYPEVDDIYDWIWKFDVDVASYEEKFNKNFWKNPVPLYHATTEENDVKSIQKYGLEPRDKTRGINNRSVGHAIFTTSNEDETLEGTYGDFVFEINTNQMKADGNMPFVGREPPIVENELRERLANYIGVEFNPDYEGGISSDTVIVYGTIKPKYLKLDE